MTTLDTDQNDMRDIKRLRETASPPSNDISSQAMPLPTWCHQGQQSASSDGLRHRPVQTKSTPRCRSAAMNPYGTFQPQLNSWNTVLAVTSDDRSWIRRISGVHRPFPSRNGKRRLRPLNRARRGKRLAVAIGTDHVDAAFEREKHRGRVRRATTLSTATGPCCTCRASTLPWRRTRIERQLA